MGSLSRVTLIAGVTIALVLGLTGCDAQPKTQAHKDQVNAANDRWRKMRSSLMLAMAQQQFDTGDLDEADKTLKDAFSQDPKNPKTLILIGRISLERGQLERASLRFTDAIKFSQEECAKYIHKDAAKHSDKDGAKPGDKDAAKLTDNVPDAHYYEGIVLQRWQRYDQALEQYRKAFELEHDNLSYLLAMSEMMVALDRIDDAIALLNDKVTYFDQSGDIRVALGQLQMMKRNYPQAVKFLQAAQVLKPDDMQVLEALAQAQVQAGQDEDAIDSLERLCRDQAGENRRDLQRELGDQYMKIGRPADAKEIFMKLTESDPEDGESWIRLGEVAWSMQDTGGTLLAANRAMTLAPKNQEGYLLAGMVWQERGRLDEALTLFDRAAELAPQSADAMVLRGIALQQAGRRAAATQAYAEALRRSPEDQRVKTLLANVNTGQGSNSAQP